MPEGETLKAELLLVCGTTYSLEATEKTVTGESGATYVGHFGGWFEQSATGVWMQLDGWGKSVESVAVGAPRALRASFSKDNRWPILRLRNPAEAQYVAFSVAGVRTERVQVVNADETVVLTHPNDYFCDPFSVVQVRMEKYNAGDKFIKWKQLAFGTVAEPGTAEIGDYATTQDLSIFMTGNLHLVPVFYTGALIPAEATLADGVDATWGNVSLEGDAVERESDAKGAFAQGDTVTFVASPRNGYKFDGWSSTADGKNVVSTEARYAVAVDLTMKLYAVFSPDRNAIYTFGTGSAVKRMRWHSKRITTNSPTSFSVAQVDAEGYTERGHEENPEVALTVYQASSPDVPADGKQYAIYDGNSRRLVYGKRGEKAFEFEIESIYPVNRVAVSTSVPGLLSAGA